MTRIMRPLRCVECGRPTGEEVEVPAERTAPPPGLCDDCAALTEPSRPNPHECSYCGSSNWCLDRHSVYEWDGTNEGDTMLVFYLDALAEINVDLEEVSCGDCGQSYDGPYTVTHEPATEGRD